MTRYVANATRYALTGENSYHIEFVGQGIDPAVKHIDFTKVKISSKLLVCISTKRFASKPYASQ
jgi:hypothetical protein